MDPNEQWQGQYTNTNYPSGQGYGQPPYYSSGYRNVTEMDVRGTAYEPVSSWGWVGYLLLLGLPIAGFILSIVWACGGCQKRSLTTFCRALWLFVLLLVIIIVALDLIILSLGYSMFWSLDSIF